MKSNPGTRFAKTRVASEPASEWSIALSPDLHSLPQELREALRAGAALALAAQARLGRRSHRIEVLSLAETVSDSTVDAVECSAAIATWKSLGGEEASALLSFAADRWSVSFGGSAASLT